MKRTRIGKDEGLLINRTDAARLIGLPKITLVRMETEDGKLTPIKLRSGRNTKVYYKREQVLALINV